MWVTRPGDESGLPGVEAEATRLQAEITAIEALGDPSACCICGCQAALTIEHAPSKKAGNVGPMIRGMIDDVASSAVGAVRWQTERTYGATYETLCASCNNHTGSWYNPAYVRFVRIAAPFAQPKNAGDVCHLNLTVHRQRVAKQAIAHFAATLQPGLTARYPVLHELLLNRGARRPIAPLHLWLYLRANRGGMSTGLTVALKLEQHKGHLVASFAFWPLGWLLTIGDIDADDNVIDVSGWTELDYNDKTAVTVAVPCQWGVSPYPGDFRSAEEIEEAWTVGGPPTGTTAG
jgi:hypothetical protein